MTLIFARYRVLKINFCAGARLRDSGFTYALTGSGPPAINVLDHSGVLYISVLKFPLLLLFMLFYWWIYNVLSLLFQVLVLENFILFLDSFDDIYIGYGFLNFTGLLICPYFYYGLLYIWFSYMICTLRSFRVNCQGRPLLGSSKPTMNPHPTFYLRHFGKSPE